MSDQEAITESIKWDGRIVRLSYELEYFEGVAHLEIRSADGEQLPITETGYKSHFFMTEDAPGMKAIIDLVSDWLNEEAKSRKWQSYVEQSKQMSLF